MATVNQNKKQTATTGVDGNIRKTAQREYVQSLQQALAKKDPKAGAGVFVLPVFDDKGKNTGSVVRETISPTLSMVMVMSIGEMVYHPEQRMWRQDIRSTLIFAPTSFLATKYQAGANIGGQMSLTRGPLGIPNIPSIPIFGWVISSNISFLLLSLFILALVWFILRNIAHSGFGKILIAISEDEIYTQSIGKNVYQAKIISFTLSAMLAAIPGTLYAHYISYIDPTSFTVSESIFILSIVIIGGLGNLTGSFVAAAFLVLLPEALRFVGMPDSIAANMRQIAYGLILVVVVVSRKSIFSRHLRVP